MKRYKRTRRRGQKRFDVRVLRDAPPSSLNEPRPKRELPIWRLVLVALLLFGVLYLASALFEEDTPTTVVVEQGDTLSSVADKLEEAGVITSSTLFKLEARIKGGAKQIKPGEYLFEPGEGGGRILETLASGDSISAFTIAIPEGLTLRQTAQTVSEQSDITVEEFEAAAKRTDYGYPFLDDPAIKTTEGFLFPKKYEFERGANASEVADRLLGQYLLEKEGMDFAGAQERLGLTEYELVTTASLIEEESANPEERALVASVIYNRIRAGMPLQIDSTIQYALGRPKEELSLDDLEIESPYNTYKNRGLPPTPISNPSRESIEAALNPADTDFLYYVLEAGGEEHFFTDDYEEFLVAKDEEAQS